jgi:hypothetical protein
MISDFGMRIVDFFKEYDPILNPKILNIGYYDRVSVLVFLLILTRLLL